MRFLIGTTLLVLLAWAVLFDVPNSLNAPVGSRTIPSDSRSSVRPPERPSRPADTVTGPRHESLPPVCGTSELLERQSAGRWFRPIERFLDRHRGYVSVALLVIAVSATVHGASRLLSSARRG